MDQYYFLEQMMRWFGPGDPVSLKDIAQAGCSGVVTALHHIPAGEVWQIADIRQRKAEIQKEGMVWTVVESLPVHEDIKTASGEAERYLENYKISIRNLADAGIKVITYNFMPILDWVRTDVRYARPDGSEALKFDRTDFGVFDLFLIERPNAEADYTPDEISRIRDRYRQLTPGQQKRIFRSVLMGLPGSGVPLNALAVIGLLEKYRDIDDASLRKNFITFLHEVTPVAEECGIFLAIHPDDPPFPVLGLPRIMNTDADIEEMVNAVPSPANGLCFCTGSFGARADNDIPRMMRKWGSRIFFLHLRNTKRESDRSFYESDHLDGDTDMISVVEEAIRIMQQENRRIPMRPDHGHKMLNDLGKETYPGYSAIGRLKGLAELRGLELGLMHGMTKQHPL